MDLSWSMSNAYWMAGLDKWDWDSSPNSCLPLPVAVEAIFSKDAQMVMNMLEWVGMPGMGTQKYFIVHVNEWELWEVCQKFRLGDD